MPPLDANVVAMVQGTAISQESLRRKVQERLGPSSAAMSAAKVASALEEMIRYEAVYAQARAAKFEEQPEIAARIKNLIVSQFIQHQLETEDPKITSEQLREYYTKHGAEFLIPASARGAIILLRAASKMEPEKRDELRQHAASLLLEAQQIKNEADFVRLVQRHSEHQATRYRGGELGWMTRVQCESTLGPELSDALFALKHPDDFAPLLETPDGFYILRLREVKEAHMRPLAEAEELIRYQLCRQHQSHREEEFYARMQHGLDIQINRALLESFSVPRPEQEPPALPGGRFAQRRLPQ